MKAALSPEMQGNEQAVEKHSSDVCFKGEGAFDATTIY
jgi:hypothetical protein